ncbi:hypothetical protein JK358_32540 [Nocardia sp. 2]|uniref:DUF8020 domain-containing protein n=1 Tax=Nocardia acididurans TaxID=2802282 RepID=A0ABS1MEU2_9NOCA|nr:hypothetical protein [Nocardia acididurans]
MAGAQPDVSGNSSVTAPVSSGVDYRASLVDHSVVLSTTAGSLAAKDDRFQIIDAAGNTVASLPLSYQRDGLVFSIAAEIHGNTATLTPGTDPAVATPVPAGTPVLKDIDATANPNFNQALSNLTNEVSVGVAVGSLIGTAIGAGIGCIAGGVVAGAAGAAITIGTLAVPAALGGCLVTGAALGAIGAVAGTILVGGPVATIALFQFATELATPPAPAN